MLFYICLFNLIFVFCVLISLLVFYVYILLIIYTILCEAHFIAAVYEMCYIIKLPCL